MMIRKHKNLNWGLIFALVFSFSFWAVVVWAYTDTIDTSLPAGSDDPAEADDNMRRIQGGFQEILAVEHNVDLTGTVITGDGTHTDITADSIANAGNFSVNTNKFTITGASGNTLVAGTLDVSGNIDPTTYETTNGGFLDEDNMASDSATKVASQQSIKAYVDGSTAASAAKAWCQFASDGTLQSGSYNVTSVGKDSTGVYTVTWDTDFADTKYAVVATAITALRANHVTIDNVAEGSCKVNAWGGDAVQDVACSVVAFGTQ